jgi:hypothetical protein
MSHQDVFRTKVRQFDPLGIGAWAPESEFDYMLPVIDSMADLGEPAFVAKATTFFVGCFDEGELVRTRQEVETFFKGLHRERAAWWGGSDG